MLKTILRVWQFFFLVLCRVFYFGCQYLKWFQWEIGSICLSILVDLLENYQGSAEDFTDRLVAVQSNTSSGHIKVGKPLGYDILLSLLQDTPLTKMVSRYCLIPYIYVKNFSSAPHFKPFFKSAPLDVQGFLCPPSASTLENLIHYTNFFSSFSHQGVCKIFPASFLDFPWHLIRNFPEFLHL